MLVYIRDSVSTRLDWIFYLTLKRDIFHDMLIRKHLKLPGCHRYDCNPLSPDF